ncbi:hypothetical protein L3Q82_020413, partial [Scortum barcoo]
MLDSLRVYVPIESAWSASEFSVRFVIRLASPSYWLNAAVSNGFWKNHGRSPTAQRLEFLQLDPSSEQLNNAEWFVYYVYNAFPVKNSYAKIKMLTFFHSYHHQIQVHLLPSILVLQDFELLFGLETSSKLLEKWGTLKPKVIEQAKNISKTPLLDYLIQSAEENPDGEVPGWDSDMASLLLLVLLLPPPPRGKTGAVKISFREAVEHVV